MSWVELTQGTITLHPGDAYAVVASIKNNHTPDDIKGLLASRGLTLLDYGEQSDRPSLTPDPDPGYRTVEVMAKATVAGSIPWSVPFPASLVDSSHIVRAWVDSSPPATSEAAPNETLPASAFAPVTQVVPWPRTSARGRRREGLVRRRL